MTNKARNVLIFRFFILLTTSVVINSAETTNKDDYYVTNYQNPSYTKSELTVINQSDPIDNTQGKTYDCLDFISRIKENERNIVGYDNYCSGDCSLYSKVSQLHEDSAKNDTNHCPGQLRDCVQYEKPSMNALGVFAYHLSDWIMSMFGNKYTAAYLPSYKLILRLSCPICNCYCDNYLNPNLTTFICLDPVLANVTEKYVVTGARLKVVNRTLRIQIQQGKLFENVIDSSTRHWKEIDVCKKSMIMNYDNRTMHMDDIILPEDFIVTGVSFSWTQSSKGFYLSVYGKPSYELQNPQINSKEFFNPPGNRINVMTPDMEVSIFSQEKNVELSIPGQSSVIFQTMGLTQNYNFDDRQLIPFLDIRDIISNSDTKFLRGMGIYWRGQKNYGGYIAFKLFIDQYPVETKFFPKLHK